VAREAVRARKLVLLKMAHIDTREPAINPTKKLVYFEVHGRARPCRMLLDHAKVKYEDCRITQEAYGAMK